MSFIKNHLLQQQEEEQNLLYEELELFLEENKELFQKLVRNPEEFSCEE